MFIEKIKRVFSNLTFQVLFAITAGIIVGIMFPSQAIDCKVISDTFFKVVKMLIPLIVFFSVVNGIGSIGSLKKLGSLGAKSLLYFEIVTTLALVIGLILANVIEPGKGVDFSAVTTGGTAQLSAASTDSFKWSEFIQHLIPGNAVKAFAEGDVVQVLIFAILFGMGLTMMEKEGELLITVFDKILHVLFNILSMLMKFAPIAAFAAMAFAIGQFGLKSLIPMGKVMLTFYGTAFLFITFILGSIAWYTGFNIFKFIVYIKDELLIVLGTCSSETVLNRIMKKLENAGCKSSLVRFVVPTGYSFNLDGSTIYLSVGCIFLAQAYQVPLSWEQQVTIIFILMFTSKGAAAVHGSAIVILASTLSAMKIIPVEGVAILFGVDRFMSEVRATTNLIGNGVATLFIAKTEKELDVEQMKKVINGEG